MQRVSKRSEGRRLPLFFFGVREGDIRPHENVMGIEEMTRRSMLSTVNEVICVNSQAYANAWRLQYLKWSAEGPVV